MMDSNKKTNQRHTIPNANYPSFPFYQEEIKLKTNVTDNNNNNTNSKKDNLEFSIQDKLNMCFSEMQNLKEHFDNRRRRFPCKKKAQNFVADLYKTPTGTSNFSTTEHVSN